MAVLASDAAHYSLCQGSYSEGAEATRASSSGSTTQHGTTGAVQNWQTASASSAALAGSIGKQCSSLTAGAIQPGNPASASSAAHWQRASASIAAHWHRHRRYTAWKASIGKQRSALEAEVRGAIQHGQAAQRIVKAEALHIVGSDTSQLRQRACTSLGIRVQYVHTSTPALYSHAYKLDSRAALKRFTPALSVSAYSNASRQDRLSTSQQQA